MAIADRSDVDNLAVEGIITLPHLEVSAEYDVDGRALVAPFKGQGIFKGNFSKYNVLQFLTVCWQNNLNNLITF